MNETTVCNVCWTTTSESLSEHLARIHANEFFRITTNPATGRSVIHERLPSA